MRPMTDDDLRAVVAVENSVHQAPWTLKHFEEELTKPYSTNLVITDDETDLKIAAYITFWNISEDFQILNVVVAPEFRRQGLAKALIQFCKKAAIHKNAPRILLEVRKSNLSAITLYQVEGFVITQIQKNHYSNGEDAYFMEIKLTGDDRLVDF